MKIVLSATLIILLFILFYFMVDFNSSIIFDEEIAEELNKKIYIPSKERIYLNKEYSKYIGAEYVYEPLKGESFLRILAKANLFVREVAPYECLVGVYVVNYLALTGGASWGVCPCKGLIPTAW